MHTLFPHQQEALARIIPEDRVALFMQMRLGKTPVIIKWAKHKEGRHSNFSGKYPFRVLVVGPMSVLDDWQDELRRERVHSVVRLYNRSQAERREWMAGGAGWYLINYEGVRVTPDICNLPWDVVIADESTAIRNPSAKITKVMVNGFVGVPYRAILTGDPAPEGVTNYFEQFRFLHGNFMNYGNFWVFRNREFEQNKWAAWDWRPKKGLVTRIKEYVHQHAVVMTRSAYNIGGRFAPDQIRRVELNDVQRTALREIKKKFAFEYLQTNFATVRDVWLARVAGGFSPDQLNPELLSNAKTAEVIDLMKGELRHEPVVIWFRFNEELNHVVAALNKANIPAIGVTGDTPKPDRKKIRDQFTAGRYRAICVQVRLGRFGWNLSHARTAIRYSNPYELESYSQSRDRIVHPTKADPLLEIHLVTKGTLDEAVVQALRAKRNNSKHLMRAINDAVRAFMQEGHENQTKETKAKSQTLKVRRVYPGTRA